MLCFRPSPRGSFLPLWLSSYSVAICWQLLSVCILSVKNVCGPPYQLNEFHLSFFSIALFPALHYVCSFLVRIPVRLFSSLFSVALVPFVGRGMLVWYILPFSTGSLPAFVLQMLLLLWILPTQGCGHLPCPELRFQLHALTLSSAYVSPPSSSTILVASDILIAHMDYSYFITNCSC